MHDSPSVLSSEPDVVLPGTPGRRARRFDWWQALIRVLSSIESLRDGRIVYILVASFAGAGLALATAQASLGRNELNWAIGQGSAALFIAFYGANAAGLMAMDRALGLVARDGWQAVEDALGVGHRVLLALAGVFGVVAVLAAAVLGLYWLSGLPRIGPWLFVGVVPLTVVLIGLVMLAMLAVVGPLTGPSVWHGATSWEALLGLGRLVRERLLQSAVLVGALSLVTGLVGAASSVMILAGGRVMAEASVFVLGVDIPPETLMVGLLGRNTQGINAANLPAEALPYISSATIGGGVVFALALVLPTVVYLRGVCEVYLALKAAELEEGA
jgi:hypothetical protein